jgi:predicted PolB exonuclease-like 3'-5' exonuclease
MFIPSQIEKFLFFDIETAGQAENLSDLSPRLANLWSDRASFLRDHLSAKYPDNLGKSDDDLFTEKAALQAEFGRIVCISFGKVKFGEDGEPVAQIVSYTGTEEEILSQSLKLINGLSKSGIKLIGHNIKRFDVPFICKRAFITGHDIPQVLQIWDKKPWETALVDTSELWSFGAWQEGFTSLDLLSAVLGVPSPKSDMKGSEVHSNFYSGNIEKIREYCQRDVIALIQIIIKLSNLNRLEEANIIFK